MVKVREFGGNIKTNFLGNGLPKENMYYTCLACICIYMYYAFMH